MTSKRADDDPRRPDLILSPAPGGADPTSRTDRAQSFEHGAQVYAQVRPEYPAEAVTWLLPPDAGPTTAVLDLAAGTGKLTRSLVERGLQVTAVEPSSAMRAELERALPQVTALSGTAESIPLPNSSVDAVVVGQAWHWFAPAPAAAEIARVLRPGGRLGIVWNVRDSSTDWVRDFTEIIHRGDVLEPSYQPPTLDLPETDTESAVASRPLFGPLEHATFRWHDRVTPAGLRALAASRSYLLTLDEPSRISLLDAVDHLTTSHPALRGKDAFDLPYDAQCWRADLSRPLGEPTMADLLVGGSTETHPVTADDVRECVRWLTEVLYAGSQADLDAPAGDLAWSCWRTGEHVVDDLLAYALQLAGLPTMDYVPLVAADGGDDIARVDRNAGVAGLGESLLACGELLATQVAVAAPEARAYHPHGLSDGPGFAAMGVVELLVHGYDIARGLDLDVTPASPLPLPEGPALRAVQRLFPNPPGARPAAALLWCTGRIALPGQARLTRWTWDSSVR